MQKLRNSTSGNDSHLSRVRGYAKWIALIALGLSLLIVTSFGLQTASRVSETQVYRDVDYKINSQIFGNLSQVIHDEIEKAKLFKDNDDVQLKRAEELQEYILQYIDSGLIDANELFEIVLKKLTNEELSLLANLLQSLNDVNELENFEEQKSGLERGKVHLWIYAHYSVGWLYGGIASSLITIGLVGVVAQLTGMGFATGAVVGAIIGAIVGATIGAAIVTAIDNLVYRGGEAGFTYTLIEHNQSIWFISANVEWNILDLIFELINFAGGGFVSGAQKPVGLPVFSWV